MGLEFAGELGAGAIPFFQPIGREELVPAGGRCATGRGCERDRGLQLFSGVAPSRNIETGEWSVSDRRNRAISALSQETVSEWLENRINEGTVEGLRAALEVDPANARVTAHLGRVLADQALKQGSDPDEARRVRGEANFLTSDAVKLAPDSEEVKKLRDEVIKLLELKTN
jgi:hypothetical protein